MFIKFLKKNCFFLGLAAVVLIGVRFPEAGRALKPWINKLIFFSLVLIGLRLDLAEIRNSAGKWQAVAVCLASGFLFMPLISLLIAKSFFAADPDMYVGAILAAAVPTTQASSIIWTDIARGNKALALILMAASNICGVFFSPLILHILLGSTVQFPVLQMVETLVLNILLPVGLGQLLRPVLPLTEQLQTLSRSINIVIIWAVVLTTLSSGSISSIPLFAVLSAVVIQYFCTAGLSFFGSRAMGMSINDSLAVMFCSSQVTLTFAAVIGFSFFSARSIIYIVVYHLFQQVMGQVTANFAETAQRRLSHSSATTRS